MMLEIAEFAIGLDIVAQRRSAGLDRIAQHRPDRRREFLSAGPGHGRGEAPRRQPGPIKRLADIDVTEPGDNLLVEQRRLERGHLASELLPQVASVETGAERLWPHAGEQRMRGLFATPHVIEETEAARVVE